MHVLHRVDHVGHQDAYLIALCAVEHLVENLAEISIALVTDAVDRDLARDAILHGHNSRAERAVAIRAVVGHHRPAAFNEDMEFQSLAIDAYKADMLWRTALGKEIGDISLYLADLQMPILEEVFEVVLIGLKIALYLLPVLTGNLLVLPCQFYEQVVEISMRAVRTGSQQHHYQE